MDQQRNQIEKGSSFGSVTHFFRKLYESVNDVLVQHRYINVFRLYMFEIVKELVTYLENPTT